MLTMTGCLLSHGFGYGAHVAISLALLALAAGFLCCAKAQCTEMACCKKLGKFVGGFIMIIAALVLVCLGWKCYQSCTIGGAKQCPLHGEYGDHDHGEPAPVAPSGQ